MYHDYYNPVVEYAYRREQAHRNMATFMFVLGIVGLMAYFKVSEKEPKAGARTEQSINQTAGTWIQD